ncbi:MAG: hypothetical protein J0I06_18680 [Planctomycetes bacterium]|nr:hypothetical protein [Planctomycetota bacterium]
MKSRAGEAPPQEIPGEEAAPAGAAAADELTGRWSPARLVRTCVASPEASSSFGPVVAAEAQERRFYQARQAFVADGAAYNGSIHAGYFRDFEPVVDLLHVLCYLYSSATAVGADEPGGWRPYRARMPACCQGRVAEVPVELDRWPERLGEPPAGEARSAEERHDPRRLVAEARSYLRNNEARVDYPSYRREGLPTTSRPVECRVGEFNARVKGKQKHWTRPGGAESILQLRAAVLSEDERLGRFFTNRPGRPFRKRPTGDKRSEPQPVQTAA